MTSTSHRGHDKQTRLAMAVGLHSPKGLQQLVGDCILLKCLQQLVGGLHSP